MAREGFGREVSIDLGRRRCTSEVYEEVESIASGQSFISLRSDASFSFVSILWTQFSFLASRKAEVRSASTRSANKICL